MYIYIGVVFLCYLFSLLPNLKKLKSIQISVGIILIIFLCFGYMTGTDWRTYEIWYKWADISKFFHGSFTEPGYYLYMSIFKLFHFKFWPFFIITKSLLFIILFKVIKRYYPEDIFLFWMLFLSWFGFFLFIDNPMRNLIAVIIFLLSVKHIINRSIWKYLLFCAMAISFHFTAVIMIPLYYLVNKRYKSRSIIIAFILFYIIFSNRSILDFLINLGFSNLPHIGNKISFYLLGQNPAEGKVFSLGLLLHVGLFFLVILYRKLIEEKLKYGSIIFNLAVIYFFFYRIGLTIMLLSRFQSYFSVFFIIAIISIIRLIQPQLREYYSIFLLIISLVACKTLMSDYRYVPYSNYLQYGLFNEYPSYKYRDLYNKKNSPYRNKKIEVYKK